MQLDFKQLFGCVLSASDGVIGHVKDIYFDDHSWAVRYVIADTGTWLSERLVLISPNAFGKFEPENNLLEIKLSMKQIKDSPLIDTQKPISKQFEEEYFRHYGWPYYWQPDGTLNNDDTMMEMTPEWVVRGKPTHASLHPENANLRSAQVINGYRVQASDGTIGHVSDFVVDTHVWALQEIIVKPSTWFTTTPIEIPVNQIERIDFNESIVLASITKAALEASLKANPPSVKS